MNYHEAIKYLKLTPQEVRTFQPFEIISLANELKEKHRTEIEVLIDDAIERNYHKHTDY